MGTATETVITMSRAELLSHIHTVRRSVMNLFAYVDAAEKDLCPDLMPQTALLEAANALEVLELEVTGGES